MENALILLAGGIGKRTGFKKPKQFINIGNTNLIDYFLTNLDNKIFDIIVIASKKNEKDRFWKNIKTKFTNHRIIFSTSGKTRQLSVKNSLKVLNKYSPYNVVIHDSARPLVSNKLIKKILLNLKKNLSCIPYIIHNDYIKTKMNVEINNKELLYIQTPQGFNFKKIYNAHQKTDSNNAKDDSILMEKSGIKLKLIRGEIKNLKITTKEDLKFFDQFRLKDYRSGIGYDIHKINFQSNKKLTLCGVKIPHPPLIGHSDADVCYHAVCDSIFGALSMKDIGYYFNDKNSKWKNANSKIFVKFCNKALIKKNYKIINLDINIICETPNIKKYASLMKKNLSKLLQIPIKNIAIKATTNEKISFIGKGEGIAAESIVQISNA